MLFRVEKELPHNGSKVRMIVDKPEERKAKTADGLLYGDEYYSSLLESYFRLDTDLNKLYESWKDKPGFNEFYAVRLLKQVGKVFISCEFLLPLFLFRTPWKTSYHSFVVKTITSQEFPIW